MFMVNRLPSLFPICLFSLFLTPEHGLCSEESPPIPGPAIEQGLKLVYEALKDRKVETIVLEETRHPDDRPVAERYPGGIVRLETDMLVDSLLIRPEVNLPVFIEQKSHLAAELWKISFEETDGVWKPVRFKALVRADIGDIFAPADTGVYAFDSLEIIRDSAVFHITNGVLIPAMADQNVGRVVILGKGRFTFTPANNVERQQLMKYSKSREPVYTNHFTQMALLLSPEGYRRLIQDVKLRRVKNGRLFKQAKSLLKHVEEDYAIEMEATRRAWSFVPTHPEYLRAEFDLSESRNWLTYSYNPFELEEVSLVQKSGFPRNFKLKPPVVWCRFSRTEGTLDETGSLVEDPSSTAMLDIKNYRIDGRLENNRKKLKLKTIVEVAALEDSLHVMTFMLNDKFRIRRVDYADGEGALFIKQGLFISVPLLEPLSKGQITKLTFWYEGNVVEQINRSFFTPLRNEQWLPQHSNRDAFIFDMVMRLPKSLTTITTGTRVLDYEEGDIRVNRWHSGQPLSLLGLTFSDHRTMTTRAQGVDVTVYTDRDLLKTASREEEIVKLIDETLPFYSQSFGAYPYSKLDVVQMPDNYEFGQGFPTMLMLWGLYFRNSYLLDRDLSANRFVNIQQFFKGFLAHELAHQWWGNVVVPKSYRDVWLSEAMATYAADLFIENAIGRKEFLDMLKNHVKQARMSDREGAISLGSRLNQHYQPVVYDKGAMVLHMLRQVCGDEKFYTALSHFYKNSFSRLVTTEDFQRVTEEVMGRDMGWFFDQWIRDTGYPVYRVIYTSLKRDDNQYRIQCTIVQEQEGRVFTMPMPVRFELKNGETVEKMIWNHARYQTFELVVPEEIKRVHAAPDCSVYCEMAY